MGDNFYEDDVDERASSTRRDVFTYRGYIGGSAEDARRSERREVHPDLNIKNKIRECCESEEHPLVTPIGIVIDVTRSRGDDAQVMFEKLPVLIGQLYMKGYTQHPELCWAAVGDASSGDQAPIQVAQFESDKRLDEHLAKIWLEEGGGGTGQESYELMAYYFARKTRLDANKRGAKGFLFFLGDEGFYPKVAKDQVKVWIGDDIPENIPSAQIFKELQNNWEVFFVYQEKEWEQRRKDIDAEIEKRVKQAGGRYEGVDVRASLIWNNRNDLDLHVICPSGEEIWYSHMHSRCGGYLDVDMNVRGETMKPVENIRWEKGEAPKGHYKVYVQNYATHGDFAAKTPFRVEIEIGGKILHFEGETPKGVTGSQSDTPVYEFDYDPQEGHQNKDVYQKYADELIKNQWRSVIPPDNVLILGDPRGVVDLILGVFALYSGKVDLDGYINILKDDIGQTPERQAYIRRALSGYSLPAPHQVDTTQLPNKGSKKQRKRKTKRL